MSYLTSIYLTYHLRNKKPDPEWFLVFGEHLSGISDWIRHSSTKSFIIVTNTRNRSIIEQSHMPVIAYHIKQQFTQSQMEQCVSQIEHDLGIKFAKYQFTSQTSCHWQCWSSDNHFNRQWGLFNYYSRVEPAIIVMDSRKALELATSHSNRVNINLIWKSDSIVPDEKAIISSKSINHYFEDIANSSRIITRLYQTGVPLLNIHTDIDAKISNDRCIMVKQRSTDLVYLSTKAKKQLGNKITLFKLGTDQKFIVSAAPDYTVLVSVAIVLLTEVNHIQTFHQLGIPVITIDKYNKVNQVVKHEYDCSWINI